jgi:hypothetical protein
MKRKETRSAMDRMTARRYRRKTRRSIGASALFYAGRPGATRRMRGEDR